MAEPQPVIVLGAARSGTKYFRGLLSAPENAVCTPFDANYIWRFGNERSGHDELAPDSISDKQAADIRKALYKQADMGAAEMPTYFVEKTVSNALRPDFVRRVFPGAKLIVLIRDGRDAIESTFRMWNAPPDGPGLRQKLSRLPMRAAPYALWFGANMIAGKLKGRGTSMWGVRYDGIQHDLRALSLEEVCANQWLRCVRSSLAHHEAAPDGVSLLVRYEDLVNNVSILEEVADHLNMGSAERSAMARKWRDTTRTPAGSRWESTFSPQARARVESIVSPTLSELGYLQ